MTGTSTGVPTATITDSQKAQITTITIKLAQLGLEATWFPPISTGPIVSTYRFMPKSATKVNQIVSVAQDLALSLGVEDVFVRRLPGEAAIGVSVPNATRTSVLWRDTLAAPPDDNIIPLNFGVDSQGKLFREDLSQCPHLLIAGQTFSGKSVLLNGIIASLMYWRRESQVQFILSDTKGTEFQHYIGSPFVHRTCDSMYSTWEAMDWLIDESDKRLKQIGRSGFQNIQQYNAKTSQPYPYFVLVMDELADILGGEKRGESKIANAKLGRIVQKSRAAGVHVIAATQRPSVDIVVGTIKNNFPSRLSFKLGSEADSRTILDQSGANHLLPKGDMLYHGPAAPATKRLHAAFADPKDVTEMIGIARMRHAMQ